MLREWSQDAPDLWATDGFDGRWEIHRHGDRWVAIPPDGCAYPYALIAPMMQAPCLTSAQHAARNCMGVIYETIGVKELRERGPATTPASIHRQFVITSCGMTYVMRQQTADAPWVAAWSAWDRFGEIIDADLPTLVGRLREAIPEQIEGYWPQGLRSEILAEDQRIALRVWTLKQYSKSSGLQARLLDQGDQTPLEQAIPAMTWAGRAEAYSLSLGQQDDAEVALVLRRPDDKTYYPGLSL